MAKLYWKKFKAIAAVVNRRQWQRDFDPYETTAQEIEIEQGGYFIILETSTAAVPNYIITE
jgi:predicted DNA-binding transcriptional regulator YafY